MKHLLKIFLSGLVCIKVQAQTTVKSDKLEVLFHLQGDSIKNDTNRIMYHTCLGWYHTAGKREYAVYNKLERIYFADVTNPEPEGRRHLSFDFFYSGNYPSSIYIHGDYCYISQGSINGVYSLKDFPDSVTWIGHFENVYLKNAIFRKNRIYTLRLGRLQIYDLSDPAAPVLLSSTSADLPHLYGMRSFSVENDTIYASVDTKGYYRMLYQNNKFIILDSITNPFLSAVSNYANAHSADKKTVCCFYEPTTLDASFYVKQSGRQYQLASSFQLMPSLSPITPQFVENNWLLVSNKKYGLFVYDVSDLKNIKKTGYFTSRSGPEFLVSPSGWIDDPNQSGVGWFNRNLPSGNIIALDQINGVFILNPAKALISKPTVTEPKLDYQLSVFPNPCNQGFYIALKRDHDCKMKLFNMLGELLLEREYPGSIHDFVSTEEFDEGPYLVKVEGKEGQLSKIVLVLH
jgi:hypothetical protein